VIGEPRDKTVNDLVSTRVRIPLRAYLRLAAFVVCISLTIALIQSRYAPGAVFFVVMAAFWAGN
jgi:hypothetical protein